MKYAIRGSGDSPEKPASGGFFLSGQAVSDFGLAIAVRYGGCRSLIQCDRSWRRRDWGCGYVLPAAVGLLGRVSLLRPAGLPGPDGNGDFHVVGIGLAASDLYAVCAFGLPVADNNFKRE